MSLTFGAVNSDKVDLGTAFGTMAAETILAWIYPTTLTDGLKIVARNNSFLHEFRLQGTAGDLKYGRRRGTGGANNCQYVTNTTPIATLNKWYCVAVTFTDDGTAPAVHIYIGTLTTTLAEATYSTSTNGSGAVANETADPYRIGNDSSASPVLAFNGRIGYVYISNEVLSLPQLKMLQFHPKKLNANAKGLYYLGDNGTSTQHDLSGNGNNGTVTGATQSNNPPIRRCGGGWYQTARYQSSLVRVPWPLLYASGEMAA